tara:strand:- start:1072 stop:1251 length:180 start_codon:yes stop_codon:yes gene_type:complete
MTKFILNNIEIFKNVIEYLKFLKFRRDQEKNKIKKHNVLYLDKELNDGIYYSYIFKKSN